MVPNAVSSQVYRQDLAHAGLAGAAAAAAGVCEAKVHCALGSAAKQTPLK